MGRTERIALYGLSIIACVLAIRAGGALPWGQEAHAATAPAKPEPVAAKIATCDIIALAERLYDTAAFFAPRQSKNEELKEPLMPLQRNLEALKAELQGADPSKPENVAKNQEAQAKYSEYQSRVKQASEEFAKFASKQFTEAYAAVKASVAKVAAERGYTHVIASRDGPLEPIPDAARLHDDVITRPVILQPEGSDITEDVRLAMGLPEKPVTDSPLLNKGGDKGGDKPAEKNDKK